MPDFQRDTGCKPLAPTVPGGRVRGWWGQS
jgi:hypothetical protein